MILPNKHISLKNSLLSIGALILDELFEPMTVSVLWSKLHDVKEIATFDRLVLSLDLLYVMGIIELDNGLLIKHSLNEGKDGY